MDIVRKIREADKGTFFLVETKVMSNDFGQGHRYNIFSKYGDNIEKQRKHGYIFLTGEIGGITILPHEDLSQGVSRKLVWGNNMGEEADIVIPTCNTIETFKKFKYVSGENKVRAYLTKTNHWGEGVQFKKNLEKYLATVEVALL